MSRQNSSTLIGRGALMTFSCLVALLTLLMPVAPDGLNAYRPDLVAGIACLWVLRQPETAPVFLIFILAIFADFLMDRPVGLSAIALMLTTELLRRQRRQVHDLGFAGEWVLFSVAIVAQMLFLRVMLWLATAPQIPLADAGKHLLATALSYPLLALLLRFGLRLRWTRLRPGADWSTS